MISRKCLVIPEESEQNDTASCVRANADGVRKEQRAAGVRHEEFIDKSMRSF